MKKKRQFKFLRTGLKSEYDGYQWEMGKWHKTECVELCHGFNCSEKILDALAYVRGEILAEVEAKGEHFTGDDKSTWSEMRIIRAWNWTKKDSVALSIFAAELVLQNFESAYPKDDRPRKAIEAAKKFLENPTEENRSAAWSAAESAAWSARSAARSARSAAESAAWSARSAARSAESARSAAESAWSAWSAAESARSAAWSAWSAAWSARSAARSAESARSALLDKINAWLIAHLDEMEGWES